MYRLPSRLYFPIALFLAILFVLLQGCDETTPVEPDPDVVIEEKILEEKTATIGPEGGSIALEDGMTMEIPPGAVGQASSMKVQKIGSERFFAGPNRAAYRIHVPVEPSEAILTFPVEPGGTKEDIGVLNYDPENFFQTEAEPYPFEYDATTGHVTVNATASRTARNPSASFGKSAGKIGEKNTWIVEKEPLVEPDVESKVVDMPYYAQDQLTCWAASIHMMTRGYKTGASSKVPDYLRYAGYPPTTGPGSLMYRVKVPSLLNIHAHSGATGTLYWRGASAFNNLVQQIDSGRPVLIGRSGHSVMVLGYKKTTGAFGPAAYQFLVHDPGDPDWSNLWKDWDWVINQTISFTTFAEVWIPAPPLADRPLQTVGLPLSGATGFIRFTHKTSDGNTANDATLGMDPSEPNWYGWKRTVGSLDEIPGSTDTLSMKLPLWNADRSNAADVSLRISVRKLDEGEVYSTHEFTTLPVAHGPKYFFWSIPVKELRTGKGEPDYRLKVELLKGGSKTLDQFDVDFRLGPPIPIIESVTPDPATAGEEIAINGVGFGDNESAGQVSLGGNRLYDVIQWSDTRIRVTLPESARTGDLVVKVGDQESEPYYLEVRLHEDLLPKLNTSIVVVASFNGIHTSSEGTQFPEIEISSAETNREVEWGGTGFTLTRDWTVPDDAGGRRIYTFRMNGSVAPTGDSIINLTALYSERWEGPDDAFVQITTKELAFGGVPYERSVISDDQKYETLVYYLYGATVQSKLSKAVWRITDETGDVKFEYESTDWANEYAPPSLSVAFGRENK